MSTSTEQTTSIEAKRRRRRRHLILCGLLVIEFLVVFELLLRYVSPIYSYATPDELQDNDLLTLVHRRSSIPGLEFEVSPDLNVSKATAGYEIEIRTNNLGMRDNEPAPGDDVWRVAVLGDSFTFGWGVTTSGEIYTELLEKKLNSAGDGPTVDVMNFAVMGYAAIDQPLMLEH